MANRYVWQKYTVSRTALATGTEHREIFWRPRGSGCWAYYAKSTGTEGIVFSSTTLTTIKTDTDGCTTGSDGFDWADSWNGWTEHQIKIPAGHMFTFAASSGSSGNAYGFAHDTPAFYAETDAYISYFVGDSYTGANKEYVAGHLYIHSGTVYKCKATAYSGLQDGGSWDFYTSVTYSVEQVRGTSQGYVASTSSGAYPSNGISGSYWYVYKGSDCIDPTAVGYSTTTPKGGEAITVNVTPRSNTYGGTITYKYQYSTDGGSTWTDAGSTTATSKSITVPKGSTQFRARVLASDNYGFTSTTYVTGANLTVKNDSTYAGVSGTVKAVSAVACVGGAIKTNVSMYQGVNGTVKQS